MECNESLLRSFYSEKKNSLEESYGHISHYRQLKFNIQNSDENSTCILN